MRVNQQEKKLQLVCDPEELMRIAICLSESPILSNRKLAFELRQAMDDLNKRSEKK